ncbi:MAG: orotate phosphoribosyltransferase [Deltaproteobacteria bacterium]|nr:orotate phosphoribosyltransferase [Deltaproteobacteria bacterium]
MHQPETPNLFERRHSRLLELLLNHSFERKHVVLASGKESDYYIDCRKTALLAEGHFLIGWIFNSILRNEFPLVRAVGGMSMGADPLVSATALTSTFGPIPLDAFYVRKEAKKHGSKNWVEMAATIEPGAKVAILEDVVTTGGSTIKAMDRAEAVGLEVSCVLALVDRLEGGGEAVSKRVPFHPLFTRNDLMGT